MAAPGPLRYTFKILKNRCLFSASRQRRVPNAAELLAEELQHFARGRVSIGTAMAVAYLRLFRR